VLRCASQPFKPNRLTERFDVLDLRMNVHSTTLRRPVVIGAKYRLLRLVRCAYGQVRFYQKRRIRRFRDRFPLVLASPTYPKWVLHFVTDRNTPLSDT
jgi:hypothetical protein